jgi:ribosomal protein S27E
MSAQWRKSEMNNKCDLCEEKAVIQQNNQSKFYCAVCALKKQKEEKRKSDVGSLYIDR